MTGMCLVLSKSNDYSEYNIIGEEKHGNSFQRRQYTT